MTYLPALAVLLVATAFAGGGTKAMAQQGAARTDAQARRPPGPDYSQVNSREKAQQLAEKGELVPVLLLPQAFGGDRRPENVVFVPPFAAQLKQEFEQNIVRPLVMQSKIKRYEVKPAYAGTSFVPIALDIHAYDPADVNYRIAIWGQALR